MKSLLVILLFCTFACGKKATTSKPSCRNKESMITECRVMNQPTYGYGYAQEMCRRTYTLERCY